MTTYYAYNPQITSSEIDNQFWDYYDGATTPSTNITAPVLRDQWPVFVLYGILLAVGGAGNVAVLVRLARSRRRKSSVDLLMTHLAFADICVTCGVIPLEIGWKYTSAWVVGNLMCKLLQVLRAFGLYLSSNVLVCISLDRFFGVIYPLRFPVAWRRSKKMLFFAWVIAFVCSLPQSIVFRVKQHPQVAGFEQCVSFGAFSSEQQEVVYNVFCLCAMYFLPLVVITVCYVCIFCKIHRSSKELDEKRVHRDSVGDVRLRRSDRHVLERARRRTLHMTVTIVTVFTLCWLPYATITVWYMVDRQSASQVSPRVQDLLFAMAVSNSCINPLVYGPYTLDIKGLLRRLLQKICCNSSAASDTIGNAGSSSKKNININLQTLVQPVKSNKSRTRLGDGFAETSLTAVPKRLQVGV